MVDPEETVYDGDRRREYCFEEQKDTDACQPDQAAGQVKHGSCKPYAKINGAARNGTYDPDFGQGSRDAGPLTLRKFFIRLPHFFVLCSCARNLPLVFPEKEVVPEAEEEGKQEVHITASNFYFSPIL